MQFPILRIVALIRNTLTFHLITYLGLYGDSFLVIQYTCIPISQEESYMLIIQTQGDGTVAPHWSQGYCSINLSPEVSIYLRYPCFFYGYITYM